MSLIENSWLWHFLIRQCDSSYTISISQVVCPSHTHHVSSYDGMVCVPNHNTMCNYHYHFLFLDVKQMVQYIYTHDKFYQWKLGTLPYYNQFVWSSQHFWNNISQANEIFVNWASVHQQVIAYIKDKATNLNTLPIVLTFVVSCPLLQLSSLFNGTCFGHVMSKACQYATNDSKVRVGMKDVSLAKVEYVLQK